MISCIVPAYNEEGYIEQTLSSLLASAKGCVDEVEIIVVDDGSTDETRQIVLRYPEVVYKRLPHESRVVAKNHGAKVARGEILAFVDADCTVSSEFFKEISEKAQKPFFIGGGVKYVKLPRLSFGLLAFLVAVAFTLLFYQITIGAFWVRREVFNLIGGFREYRLDDVDFARRLKKHASKYGGKFESLKKCTLVWSTRKFDQHGDWHWTKMYR